MENISLPVIDIWIVKMGILGVYQDLWKNNFMPLLATHLNSTQGSYTPPPINSAPFILLK